VLKKYLESVDWVRRNPSEFDEAHRARFDAFLVTFDAWVAAQTLEERTSIENHIKAYQMTVKVFPESKINKEIKNEVTFPRY